MLQLHEVEIKTKNSNYGIQINKCALPLIMDLKKPKCLKNGDTLKYINIFTQNKSQLFIAKTNILAHF